MHGPASDGATMSATEVTRQCGTVSAIWLRDPGVEDRHHQRHARRRGGARAARSAAGRRRRAWRRRPRPGFAADRVAQRVVVRALEPVHVRAGGVQRLAHLLGEVATSHEQHAPALRHARHPTSATRPRLTVTPGFQWWPVERPAI